MEIKVVRFFLHIMEIKVVPLSKPIDLRTLFFLWERLGERAGSISADFGQIACELVRISLARLFSAFEDGIDLR